MCFPVALSGAEVLFETNEQINWLFGPAQQRRFGTRLCPAVWPPIAGRIALSGAARPCPVDFDHAVPTFSPNQLHHLF